MVEVKIGFVTLFPDVLQPALGSSILGRAESSGIVQFEFRNPRSFATDKHRTVDDAPFGGGPGMVMKPDVVHAAIQDLSYRSPRVILFEPWGERFEQRHALELSQAEEVVLVCGHYEGIDGRVAEHHEAQIFSIGDFVLTSGEWPALIVADAVTRLLPGALGNEHSLGADSHSQGLLTGPQYTRPWDWQGLTPPEVLKSGDHAAIAKHHRQMSLRLTRSKRPDLFVRAHLDESDLDLL